MIDIHCHLLNSIDDGSQSEDWTLSMLKTAIASGIDQIIATPHCWPEGRYQNDNGNIERAYREALALIQEYKLAIKLYKGCELFKTNDSLAWIRNGKASSLNNSRYYLIELPWISPQEEAKLQTAYLQSIIDMGKLVIIAHPERYSILMNDNSLVKKWREMGCYFQINRTSLLNADCWEHDFAWQLVNAGYVDIIATDAHHTNGKRIMRLDDIYDLLQTKFDKRLVDRWFNDNAQKVINDEII